MDFVSIDVSRVVVALAVTATALVALRVAEWALRGRAVARTRRQLGALSLPEPPGDTDR